MNSLQKQIMNSLKVENSHKCGKYLAVNLAAMWGVVFPLKSLDAYQNKLKGVSKHISSVFTAAKAQICLFKAVLVLPVFLFNVGNGQP